MHMGGGGRNRRMETTNVISLVMAKALDHLGECAEVS